MTQGPVRVMEAGVVVIMCVGEVCIATYNYNNYGMHNTLAGFVKTVPIGTTIEIQFMA